MLSTGNAIVYSVPDKHLTVTLKREGEVQGSVHHHELTEFAGLVTRVYEDGEVGLVIFPPNRPHVTVDKVPEGDGPGTARLAGGGGKPPRTRAPKPAPAPVPAPVAAEAPSPQPSPPDGGEGEALNPLIELAEEEPAGVQ